MKTVDEKMETSEVITKEIVTSQPTQSYEVVSQLPSGDEANNMIKWAGMMAETKFYQSMISTGGKNAVVALFLAARELEIPPMQAINGGLWIVQGRVTLSAQMMGMLIRRRGHSLQKVVGNDKEVTIKGVRKDTGETCEVTWTWAQAERAGLTKNPVWGKYPETMLYNRALSTLAKQLFQDAIGNALVEGEMEEIEVVDVKEEPGISKETALFIDKHNLLDEASELSIFIDRIAATLSKKRIDVIADAAKDEEKFLLSFENYKKKKA
jgi:hypothetical protein